MDAENLRPDIQFQFAPLREGRPRISKQLENK